MGTEKITSESGIELLIEKGLHEDVVEVLIRTDEGRGSLLHWGLRQRPYGAWQVPPQAVWPEGSRAFDHSAVQTPFIRRDGKDEISFRLDLSFGFRFMDFVLFFPGENRWDNNRGNNYRIEIPAQAASGPSLDDRLLEGIANEIIDKEVGRGSWTLMHRFDLCYELLDKVPLNNVEGLALIFVWLRYSAIRQLDWQRNYNTKPRELGHAMERLTLKLAGRYTEEREGRGMIRLMMTTLGRGSNAQRVRDEVLNIMHRHSIKEVSGHFMEEWHQKLHNNTTPDDVAICEAYLEFLKSNGNADRFYERLEQSGITKERLEGYERPIRSKPDFIPHLKDALIYDFQNFLGILKEVHSGADLGIAINSSRRLLDAAMNGLMDFIWSHRDDPGTPLPSLAKKITGARRYISGRLEGPSHEVRDLLFLDIALEDFLRNMVEQRLGRKSSRDELVELVSVMLDNLSLSDNDEELLYCLRHWGRLGETAGSGRQWPLHAEAVLDRIRRAAGSLTDRYYQLVQPKAVYLGNAFGADPWAIGLFSEEVMRGRPAFALSLVMRYLDPVLRKEADLGDWQLISRGEAVGEVNTADSLKSVQGKSFERPVILIVDKITGNEEIPGGVSAIITPEAIDGLSHLAIRARNAGILFASCYNSDTIDRLRAFGGRILKMRVGGANDVVFEESSEELSVIKQQRVAVRSLARHGFTAYAVPMRDFSEQNVGYKSTKLKGVRARLPEWINIPASVALPFGVFEKVLSDEMNRETAEKYEEMLARIDRGEDKRVEALAGLQKLILELKSPEILISSLSEVMKGAGMALPVNWDEAWTCIKRVWGSKWNERAYLSRKANGIPHEDLSMSVLVQRAVESDYSFVIHTINPLTGEKDEIYSEVVLGLGETLAANYPGKAMGFTYGKGSGELHLLSFPSKSIGLYGGGLIFRSDSNGEDLAHYAGAGLYDSFVLPQPRRAVLDYTSDPLLWDDDFRRRLLNKIAAIGETVEGAMKYPQDIEGAFSKGKYFVVQTRPQVGLQDG